MVVINLRDPPMSIKEMKKAGNQLHYEIIRFPITSDLTQALTKIKSQLDDFKTSTKSYYLFTA